jgi:predicted SprT family Zn-dependent metalloprotease
MLRRWATLWGESELQDCFTLCYNPRLRATIARWVIASNRLEIGARFFELRRDHREILCHELAHAAAVRRHGRAVRPHGPEWRELVRKAEYEPNVHRVSDRTSHAAPRGIRAPLAYEHRCPVCQSVRYGRKPVKSWRCVECVNAGLPGHLTIRVMPRAGAVQ